MNPIEELEGMLRKSLPSVGLELRRPRNPQGTFWLDATLAEHWVSVEWSARRGFGVTASVLGDGYGEGPEEVFEALPQAFERVRALLAERKNTHPPTKVMLQDLRARLGITQQQLAEKLGVRQAAVSRLERREDISWSSLIRYVEALGGALEVSFRSAKGEAWSLLSSTWRPAERARGERENRTDRSPSLEGLVLRCQDLQASRDFYALLGCTLTEEKHGSGPLHYSFTSSGMLLELYPSSSEHPPSRALRLALQVSKPRDRVKALEAHKLLRVAQTARRTSSTCLVRDPDDNVIELKDKEGKASSPPPPPR